MNKAAIAALAAVCLLCGCAHVDDTKYEKVFFESVAAKVAKAEGREYTPPASAAVTADKTPDNGTPSPVPSASPAVSITPAAVSGIKHHASPEYKATERMPVTVTAKPSPVTARPIKKNKFKIKQLEISSDSMNFNKDTSIATFIGHVELTSQGVLLKSDRLSSKNYKDNAEATGNVMAYYKQQKTALKCGRVVYGKQMSEVKAYENVIAEKYLDNGNTVTMYADQAVFDTENGMITADKVKKRVKVTLKDIVAFSDEVVYNDETGDLLMTGKPMVQKSKSSFTAARITVDTIKKTMRMEADIWSMLWYGDFKQTKEDVSIETDKNAAPGKNLQQKKSGQ
jgi:lipopolysaccharide export system protein LptA